jgi:heme exporter protein B
MILALLKHQFKIEKNLIGAAILFSLLYGFLYSFFWMDPLSLKGFALLTWINILFALFLVSPDIYAHDLKDGFLDFILCEGISVYQIFASKILFIFTGYFIPILCAAVINGLFFNQPIESIINVILGAFILSPAIIALIHTGSLLTLHSYANGFLIPILMIPFFIPLLIFGISITMNIQNSSLILGGIGIDVFYCILGGMFSKFLMEDNFK